MKVLITVFNTRQDGIIYLHCNIAKPQLEAKFLKSYFGEALTQASKLSLASLETWIMLG